MFSKDGKTLIASAGHRLCTWDVGTGKEREERPGDFGDTTVLALSHDGRVLASASWLQQEVSLWDAADGRFLRGLPLQGSGRYVRRLSFSGDGKTLVACQGTGGFVQFWDLANVKQQRIVQLRDPNATKNDGRFLFDFCVSPDGKTVHARSIIHPEREARRSSAIGTAQPKPLAQRLIHNQNCDTGWLAGAKCCRAGRRLWRMMDVSRAPNGFDFRTES